MIPFKFQISTGINIPDGNFIPDKIPSNGHFYLGYFLYPGMKYPPLNFNLGSKTMSILGYYIYPGMKYPMDILTLSVVRPPWYNSKY